MNTFFRCWPNLAENNCQQRLEATKPAKENHKGRAGKEGKERRAKRGPKRGQKTELLWAIIQLRGGEERQRDSARQREIERKSSEREADRLVDSGGFVENPQQLSICIMKSQPQSQLVPLAGLQLPQGKRPLPPSSPSSSSSSSLQKVEPEKLKNNRHVLLLLQFSLICYERQTCNVLHIVPPPDWHTATLIDGKRV